MIPINFSDTIVVTGHYGSGKTNLSINLALDLKKQGREVALADLDIVNPYFRTADFRELAKENDIALIASEYANSNLDIPAINAALDARIGAGGVLVVDVGGDDAGAYALGRYAARLREQDLNMIYVVNRFRNLTRSAKDALIFLREIETASRMKATHVVNASNLSYETTADDVAGSVGFAREVAELAGISYAFTAIRRDLYEKLTDKQGFYPVDIYVKTPWSQ